MPANTNTQLLWYRSDLVPTPPTTWAQMIADAEQLAKEGKPHYIEIQGAQYEGATVWFNTMVASAGGSILNATATAPSLGAARRQGADDHEAAGRFARPRTRRCRCRWRTITGSRWRRATAAFQLNYPFVYPAMKADNPKLFKDFKWALYPEVIPGVPAKVTIGGIDLAVSAYSTHKNLAFQAALCLRDAQNQLIGATVGGVPPTIASLYNNPKLFPDYPMHAAILASLLNASVRPQTPVYQVTSIDISHLISPAAGISPTGTEQTMVGRINNALQSKGLVP